jgi:transposase
MAKKRSKKRWKLTDEQWAKIERLLPKHKPSRRGGRPRIDDRRVFEGILWILRTGAPWEDVPKQYAVVPPAGDGCETGKSKISGWTSGGPFWPTWTNAASWIGANASSTAVSPPQKKGRMRGKDQERQGNEVDGGGRRPRCSSGKPPGLGVPGGSLAARKNNRSDRCAAERSGPTATKTQPHHCRQGV